MSWKYRSVKRMVLALVVVAMLAVSLAGVAAAADQTNGITSLVDGATLKGIVEVKGIANDPSFSKWQLDLLPGGDQNAAIFLATGNDPGEFTYSLDADALPAGEHALRLRVVRADSNYDESVTKFNIGAPVVVAAAAEAAPAVVETVAAAPAAAVAAPVAVANGLTSLKDGDTLKGVVVLKGIANDPNFSKWQLDVLPGGDENAAIFLALNNNPGEFTYSLDADALPAGEHALRLRVVRSDSNYDESVTKFNIGAPVVVAAAAEAAPAVVETVAAAPAAVVAAPVAVANGLTALKDGDTLKGVVALKGVANDPNFSKWQLDVLPGGDANAAIFVASGNEPGEFSHSLDTTAFPAGEHALRLRVVRSDSNYDEFITKINIAQ
jgi:hypothetical protein